MLLEAARRTPGLAARLEPFVLQTALGDFAITYEINVGCDDPHQMAQLSTAPHRNILDVFNEYGVATMTPAHVADPTDAKLVPKSTWYLPPAKPDQAQGGGDRHRPRPRRSSGHAAQFRSVCSKYFVPDTMIVAESPVPLRLCDRTGGSAGAACSQE